ncbi:type IX secretion system membrane protein PorP/SprF [Roseivirga sp. E12]|uniref:PorP/SprF family type IX secretion system membrane protein n=1 Tax=Roseivirga sp. E12 TaxID=2819237 RepID=UPI001ABD3C91|nr:type IX secretion system membrane protein PorP/SprF [Roseivirga sp. E12]MBO3699778.1 type IX secretion system membrane protein PorP/SprF [Roseivirga sp. E12]
MKKCLPLLLVMVILCLGKKAKAQDPQFSQFYASPLYLNPALTGSTDRARVGVNYRNQWPSLTHSFTTISAYLDYFSKAAESGIGVIITEHKEGFLDFKSSEVGLLYSYKLRISDALIMRTGMQMSYFNKNLNFEELVFGNQIDIDNGQVIGPSGEAFDRGARVDFLSASAGTLLYSSDTWIGFSIHHINRPNQSFLDQESRLDRKYSLHAGYKLMFSKGRRLRTVSYQFQERSATFAVNYKSQGGFRQLDAGVQLYFQPLVIGAWYRGIPIQNVNKVAKNESIIGLFGLELNQDLSFGYSYDFTVSQLAGVTGGAHEFSLTLSFGKIVKRTRRDTILPCFKY